MQEIFVRAFNLHCIEYIMLNNFADLKIIECSKIVQKEVAYTKWFCGEFNLKP